MPTAIINGRRVNLPENTTDWSIRDKGEIQQGRTLIHRKREGNYVVPSGSLVKVEDGDVFLDAPARTKG